MAGIIFLEGLKGIMQMSTKRTGKTYVGLDNDSASTKHFSGTGRIDKGKMI